MTTASENKMNLEDALKNLEKITEQLESKELSLEDSMKLFEKGVQLVNNAKKTLGEAEQKIQKLANSNGEVTLVDYQPESEK